MTAPPWLLAFLTGGGGIALGAFAAQFGAALTTLALHPRLSPSARGAETHSVVKLASSTIVVMASVVLGLLASAMSTRFSTVGHDLRQFATDLILANRALREYGPEALPARALLRQYAERALAGTWPADGGPDVVDDPGAAALLDRAERAVLALRGDDPARQALAANAEARLRGVLDLRWTLIGEAQGSVPPALLTSVVLWLVLVFAALGYNAPRNRVVVVTLLLSAASMAAVIFLIVELDGPFDGLLKVSPRPLRQAVAELRG